VYKYLYVYSCKFSLAFTHEFLAELKELPHHSHVAARLKHQRWSLCSGLKARTLGANKRVCKNVLLMSLSNERRERIRSSDDKEP
jgi:hypothetical protein